MRIRSRSGVTPDLLSSFYRRLNLRDFGGGFVTWDLSGTTPVTLPRDEEDFAQYMQDELQKGVRRYNTCYNTKVENDYNLYPSSPFDPARTQYLRGPIIDTFSGIGSKAYADPSSSGLGIPASEVIRAVRPLLHNSTKPEFEELPHNSAKFLPLFGDPRLKKRFEIKADPFDTDFSIWYVLVDLYDFKKQFAGLAKGLISSRPRPPKELSARQLHDAHLGVRFGVLPTIRDVTELISTIRNWKSKYDDVGDVLKNRYTTHVKVEKLHDVITNFGLDDWEENLTFTLPFFQLGGPLDISVKKTTTASWHGQASYGFSCPEFQGWISRLSQIVDSFGILDPAAAWDAVPFSFVIDWFFSVSSWLHNNRPRLFPANPVVYDYLETIKVVTEVSYTLTAKYTLSVPPYYYVSTDVIGRERTTNYLRLRFLPPEGYFVLAPRGRKPASFVTLSNRVGISSSLIAQRLPR